MSISTQVWTCLEILVLKTFWCYEAKMECLKARAECATDSFVYWWFQLPLNTSIIESTIQDLSATNPVPCICLQKSMKCTLCTSKRHICSLIPRPHQSWGETVWWTKSLLQKCNLATIKTFCGQPDQKRLRILEWRWTNFTFVREVLHNNYRSRNLIC